MLKLLAIFLALAAARAQDAPPPEASISGTVMQSDGTPMKGVQVSVPLGPDKSASTMTDESGRYSLKGLPVGQRRVVASAADREGRIGGFGPNTMRQVTLRAGEELNGFDLRLVIFGRITGKVVDQNNEPVPGIRAVAVAREYHSGALRAVLTSSVACSAGMMMAPSLSPTTRSWLVTFHAPSWQWSRASTGDGVHSRGPVGEDPSE